MSLEQFTNGAQTTTTGAINNTSNPVTFGVTDASKFPTGGNFVVLIDQELLLVTSVSGSNFTASRAQEGTVIASHLSGATVTLVMTAASLRRIIGDFNIYDSYANIPSAGVKGRRFTMSPAYGIHYVDNGSSWDLWAGDFGPFNPNLADFTTHVNFASRGSIDTSNGIFQLKDAGPATNGENIIGCFKTAPSTPWTMILVWRENWPSAANANSGIMIRDSSSGHLTGFAQSFRDDSQYVWKWNSATSFNTTSLNTTYGPKDRHLCMYKLVNDGTNLNFYVSRNFNDWLKIYSETVSGNFVATIDQVGFYINMLSSGDSNNAPGGVDIYHAVVN